MTTIYIGAAFIVFAVFVFVLFLITSNREAESTDDRDKYLLGKQMGMQLLIICVVSVAGCIFLAIGMMS